MKRKHVSKIMALFLAGTMAVTMLPVQSLAKESSAYGETKASMDVDGWVLQRQSEDTNVEIQDGWIVADEDGNGVTIDYGKITRDTGTQGWVVYDSDEPYYKNSSLEYDITFTDSEDGDWIATALATRATSGKNYEGFAITNGAGLERTGRRDGVESYAGISNLLGTRFEYNKTYHLRMETLENNITVYLTQDDKEEKLTSFESPIGLEESSFGLRIWRGGKKIKIDNIERKELVNSSLESGVKQVDKEEWGNTDVSVPVRFGNGDSIVSVANGENVLNAGTDYEVKDSQLILKKEYIANQDNNFQLQISFEKGSSASLWVVKYNPDSAKEYIWTPDQGIGMWKSVDGNGTYTLEDDGMRMVGRNVLINEQAPASVNGEIEITFELFDDDGVGGMGGLFRVDPLKNSWQGIANVNGCEMWGFLNSDGNKQELINDGTTFLSRDGVKDYKLKVRFENDCATIWLDDQLMTTSDVSQMKETMGNMGLYLEDDGEILVKKAVFREINPLKEETEERETVSITNDGLKVNLDEDFPRVAEYELNSKKMDGSRARYNYVTVNTVNIPATAQIVEQDENSVRYHVTPDPDKTGVTFDVVFQVKEDQILEMLIQNIEEPNGEPVNSISLPRQPLISASSDQEGASLDASWINGTAGGFSDIHETISEKKISTTADRAVTIPIISANGLSAAMFNNVYVDRKEFSYRAFNLPDGNISAGFWNSDFIYRGLDGEKVLPFESEPEEKDLYCRVAITEDTNGDNKVNWQDGANALKKLTDGVIPGSVDAARRFFHVGYNFASGAQQPFLKVADNMKRLSNYMDGFGQNLIFKGYANEGHDSGHADYQDVNKRAGGAEDMNVAIAEADKINSDFGIHINAYEAYPEAKMYNDHVISNRTGWAWMDQASCIRRDVDLLDGTFDDRLNKLFEKTPDLDFVYVDCWWGNRWDQLKLIGNLLGNGAEKFATENGKDMNRFNSWVHATATDASSIHHFVYHTQKDVYNSSPIYWGGYNRAVSMMSWQHNNNINSLVEQFYTNQLPQKYLMCHEVLKQTNDSATFEGNVTSGNWVITKDGNKITDGQGKIFIPWYAEDSETKNPDEAAKIYHWNNDGGETTWILPENWTNLENVYLYQTTQTGKKLVDTIDVKDGQVTINADARTPYVVYPGEAKADKTEWSVGSPMKDTGFNSRDFSIWNKSGDADVQFNDDGNGVSILTIGGTEEGAVSQTMEGLIPGQKYRIAAFVGAENGKTARVTVETPDGKTYENYLEQVGLTNQYFDSYAKGKNVQRMWIDFVQPEGETTAVVKLSGDSCDNADGKVTFMETRIVKTNEPDLSEDYVANETFEYVEQGAYGIFSPERSADGVPHLSETHLPYTSDTISGDWSLKLYGENGQGEVTVRTSPATMRLMPNTEYEMEFDTLGDGTVYVQSESDGNDKVLTGSIKTGHNTFTFITGDKDDYIVRIERGRVLDNFTVKEVIIDRTALETLVEEAKAVDESAYTKESVEYLNAVIKKAEELLETETDENALKEMYYELADAIDALVEIVDGYGRIEFENANSYTQEKNPDVGVGTSAEPADGGIVMGFTFDGAWYQFDAVDFGNKAPKNITVRYSGTYNCFDDARVEIRLGDKDGEVIGTVNTPETGDWSNYVSVTEDIDPAQAQKLTGMQSICLVLRGTRTSGKTYVGNYNWIEFTPGEERVELSTDVLEYAIELAKSADTEGVINSVKAAFEKALKDAKQMLADVNAGVAGITQADVDTCWQNLIKAMQYLSFKQGNKTDLEKVVALAADIEGRLDSYLDDGKQAFVDALAAARETLTDGDAMQDEVNEAWRGLLEAMANLRLKPDKSALETLINEASALSEDAYEAESFGVMKTALAKAQEVFADETVDQMAVTAAEENLKDAVAKLVPVSEGTKSEEKDTAKVTADKQANAAGTTVTTTANADNANTNNTAKSAKTGDSADPMAAAAMMAAAMAAVAVVWKKRR